MVMRRALLWLLLLVPLVLGWIAGVIVRVAVIVWAACVEGYSMGRGI